MSNPAPNPAAAIAPAFAQMKKLLFQPFTAQRWLVLGLYSFLEAIGGGGGTTFKSGGNPFAGNRHPGEMLPMEKLHEFTGWVHAHQALLLFAGSAIIFLILALCVLFHWLGARGTFGHLDCVATGRYEVVQAWRGHAAEANSLFRWRLALGLTFLLLFAAITIPLGMSLWRMIDSGDALTAERLLFHSGFFPWLGAVILLAIPAGLLRFFLNEFVAPLQYLRRSACAPAAREAWGLVKNHPGAFALYFLLKIAMHLAAALLIVAVGLLTCCIGLILVSLPVIGQAILQPVQAFFRAFQIQFLRQFGPEYDCMSMTTAVQTVTAG